jgi:pyruvate dehydrogenase E2 component (dihydrolipoamide acetyltransferase)
LNAAATVRRSASPYARRLAREAGIGLDRITGTGPGGRIVASDVAAVLAAGAATPPQPAPQASAIAAFSTTITLAPLRQLLADLDRANAGVGFAAMLLRAAALALEAMAAAEGQAAMLAVALEPEASAVGAPIVLADAHLGLVSALAARLAAGGDAAGRTAPRLTLRHLPQAGIRPVIVPLVGAAPLRLVLATSGDAPTGEALLVCDAARVGEAAAGALLARFRDALEQPLRLLA